MQLNKQQKNGNNTNNERNLIENITLNMYVKAEK